VSNPNLSVKFDRLEWLERTESLKPRILFLDLNYWIRLSEGQDEIYREMRNLLYKAVEKRQLICPVSLSLLMEFQKRPASNKREDIAQLMDRLSRKLSLRINLVIFTEEFRALLAGEQIERDVAYSHSKHTRAPTL